MESVRQLGAGLPKQLLRPIGPKHMQLSLPVRRAPPPPPPPHPHLHTQVITFLLVSFGGERGSDALRLALSRAGGIVAGVLLALVLSVALLPRSASVAAVHNLEDALAALRQLAALAWRDHLPPPTAALPQPTLPRAAAPSKCQRALVEERRPLLQPLLGGGGGGGSACSIDDNPDALAQPSPSDAAAAGDVSGGEDLPPGVAAAAPRLPRSEEQQEAYEQVRWLGPHWLGLRWPSLHVPAADASAERQATPHTLSPLVPLCPLRPLSKQQNPCRSVRRC